MCIEPCDLFFQVVLYVFYSQNFFEQYGHILASKGMLLPQFGQYLSGFLSDMISTFCGTDL